jgi:hypothetical protein
MYLKLFLELDKAILRFVVQNAFSFLLGQGY